MILRPKSLVKAVQEIIGYALLGIVILALGVLSLGACSPTRVLMTMESMRLIHSTASPQKVMDYATKSCQSDFYRGASFISKSGDEYTFRCIKYDDKEALNPVPGTTIKDLSN